MRSALCPDVISWSALAEPTGVDDPEAVVREVERVSLSLWGAIASTRRESGESEEAWRERRRKAYRELAPLLDRVGRLSVDVASLLEFEGNGGEIERVALEHRERVLPQRAFPAAPIAPQRARVGMDALVRGTAGGPWSLLPLDDAQDHTVVIRGDNGARPMRESVMEFLSQLLSDAQRQGAVNGAVNDVNEEVAHPAQPVQPVQPAQPAQPAQPVQPAQPGREGSDNTNHILSQSVDGSESRPPSLL